MLNSLLFTVIPLAIVVIFLVGWYHKWGRIEPGEVLLSILIFPASAIFMFFLTMLFTLTVPQEYALSETIPMYAIENNNSISGGFFLGSGGVSSNKDYYYIADYKDGKKIYDVPQNRAYIVENDEMPVVEVYESQFTNEWLRKNLINAYERKEYKFIIPENSIKYDYNVDLK